MRTIGVVTGSRADYSIYRPVLERMRTDGRLHPVLFVTGSHLSPEFGMTVSEIEADGLEITERVECLVSSDAPSGTALSMSLALAGMARAFARVRPDILLVLGDRFEMFAAAAAAVPFSIPLAHVHGGESTYGAMDESLRHAITKLSHLHFASTEAYADRIRQMGEEPWRVRVSGAPALDGLLAMDLPSATELSRQLDFDCCRPFLLATFHPATLETKDAASQADVFFEALAGADIPVLATAPNADPGGRAALASLEAFSGRRPDVKIVTHLGARRYAACMKYAAAMAGNSSSGIIEAASFALPVVNAGSRQDGRIRAANVVDAPLDADALRAALAKALDPAFKTGLAGMENPYGTGRASKIIVDALADADTGPRLVRKHFNDLERPEPQPCI